LPLLKDIEKEDARRLLKQLAREILLLESSDWQFLITTWSARDYAEKRFAKHVEEIDRLFKIAREYARDYKLNAEDENFVHELEKRDRIFDDIEPEKWQNL